MQKRDFSQRRSFPGTHNNDFDLVIQVLDAIQKLPAPIFAALLLLVAWVAALFHWPLAMGLWLFMLGDWALIAALPRFKKSFGPPQPPVLLLALLRSLAGWLPIWAVLLLQGLGTLLVVYGFWIEPHRLTVTYQTLRSAKLKPGPPLKLLHLGDLHIERITERERQLLKQIEILKPDLILFAGDLLNLSYLHDPQAWAACRWVLRQLQAPLGVYAVSGSPAVDLPELVSTVLAGLPVRWLRDEKITLWHHDHPIDIIGLRCTHKPFIDGPHLKAVLAEPPGRFTILLYHTPDLVPEAAEAGIDLQLSGHTHGGQVRLPGYGALITGSLYGKQVESGRRQVEGLTLYVTRGIGLEGAGAPRVRLLCPPEIILWTLAG